MVRMRLARPGVKGLDLLYASIIVGASLPRPSVSAGCWWKEALFCFCARALLMVMVMMNRRYVSIGLLPGSM